MSERPEFQLPKSIHRYLATLSKMYEREGERQLQEILVNSRVRINEGVASEDWVFGHALHLMVPESLFNFTAKETLKLEKKLKEDLNSRRPFQNEFISDVFLEVDIGEDEEWRRKSGLLVPGERTVSVDAAKRIWGDKQAFRLFLSHKSEVKKETFDLKERLESFGVSCFVAHVDIEPTKAWQDEIENALASMDGFVALLTEKFRESKWTDHEVGFAVARGVPIIAVRLGMDPYGFIGKFQGLSSTWEKCPVEVVKILIKHDRMFGAYVRALRECPNWDTGNKLGEVLPAIEHLTPDQIDELVVAFNETTELRGSFAFNGRNPYTDSPSVIKPFSLGCGRQMAGAATASGATSQWRTC